MWEKRSLLILPFAVSKSRRPYLRRLVRGRNVCVDSDLQARADNIYPLASEQSAVQVVRGYMSLSDSIQFNLIALTKPASD